MNLACQGAFLLFSTIYWWNQRSLDDLNLPFSHDVETISKISWCVAITFAQNMCAAVAFDIRSWNPFKRQFLNIIFLQKKQFWKDGHRWFEGLKNVFKRQIRTNLKKKNWITNILMWLRRESVQNVARTRKWGGSHSTPRPPPLEKS